MPKKKENSLRIKPLMVVICDDVREEKSGKQIIIGIYNTDLNIPIPDFGDNPSPPTPTIPLSFWIPFQVVDRADGEVHFQIVSPTGLTIDANASVKTTEKMQPHEIPALIFPRLMIPVADGNLEVKFRHNAKEKWQILRSLPIKIKKQESPNPPS